jgi:outer membrane lipoprotein-sorting protein
MRTTLVLATLALILLPNASDFPVQKPALSASADEILRKSIEASGGRKKLAAIRSLKMTGKMITPPVSDGGGPNPAQEFPAMPATIWVKRPALVRMEMTVGADTMVNIFDGFKVWSTKPGSKSFEELSGDVLERLIAGLLKGMSEFGRPLEFYRDSNLPVETIGSERLESRDVYKLKVPRKDGAAIYVFVDKANFTKLKQSEIYRDLDLDTYYGEYREVDGLLLPHYVEHRAMSDQPFSKITIEKLELNAAMDDSLFKPSSRR